MPANGIAVWLRRTLGIKQFKAARRRAWLRRAGFPEPFAGTLIPIGSWAVQPDGLEPSSVVYSFGIGREITWDLEMIRRFGVTVHAFDPTPVSTEWVGKQRLPAEFRFQPLGISSLDGRIDLYPSRTRGSTDYSRDHRYGPRADAAPVSCPVQRLPTIMRELGHSRIDVLKMDIEGSEFDVIPDILREGIPVGQLLLELHYHYRSRSRAEGMALLLQLRQAGFRCVQVSERGYEMSLVHSVRRV